MKRSAEWCLATLEALAGDDETSESDGKDLFQVAAFVRVNRFEFDEHFETEVQF